MAGPLEGVKVLDLSQVVAGPVATMLLSDQGAEIIKVEPFEGDILRRGVNFDKGGMNSLTVNCNRGKQSIAIDMKRPEGLELVKKLATDADIFVQNFRAGAIERLGISADELRAANDRLITVWMTGYGPDGPNADDPVFDPVIQAVTGHAAVQMNPRIPFPDVHRTIIMDKSTALTAAQAMTAALFARERTGKGQHIELSMLNSALSFFWPDGAMAHAMLDDDVGPGRCLYESMQLTECADGHIVYFMAGDEHWKGAWNALGHPEWGDDPRWATMEDRVKPENLGDIADLMVNAFMGFGRDEILPLLKENDVPAAPMLSIDEVPEHPQIVHNEVFTVWEHPYGGKIRQPPAAANFSMTTNEPQWQVPMLGEQTREVLAGNGWSGAEIDDLFAADVIR